MQRLLAVQNWDDLDVQRNPDDVERWDDGYYYQYGDEAIFEADFDFQYYADDISINGYEAALDLVFDQPEIAAFLLQEAYGK